MRCLGSKSRVADELAAQLEEVARASGVTEMEDRFFGGGSVSLAVWNRRGPLVPVAAEDGCRALITTYQGVKSGTFDPPSRLTREQYALLQAREDHLDPMTAIAGVFCSHGGKWFAGYIGDDDRWESETSRIAAARARDALLEMKPLLESIVLRCGNCFDDPPPRTLVYFDPPYEGTTGYPGAPPFDRPSFWRRAEEISRWAPVVVSEFTAPPGWVCIWARRVGYKGLMKPGARVERLWMHERSPAYRALVAWRRATLLPSLQD